MKKATLKVLALVLTAVMLVFCSACSQEVIVRFVDKDGNDIFGAIDANANAEDTTLAPDNITDVPPEAPLSNAATTLPADPGTPITEAPATEAPATKAPSDNTPTQAPATEAPATKAPAALSSSSSKEEIVAKYIQVYNATKAKGTFIGHDSMQCSSVTIDGKENSLVRNAADGVMGTDASKTYQLPPNTGDNDGKICATTAADITTATYKDNGDGTATIKLTPKSVKNSRRFKDAQGNMFNVMEDVASALANISLISWSQGDANSNVVLTSEGGYCEVTFNTSTNIMTKAEYVLCTTAAVNHANVLFLKDKSATAKFIYTMSYPA